MEAKQQQVEELQAMLDTALVSDAQIIEETKSTIARLQGELDQEKQHEVPKDVITTINAVEKPKKTKKPSSKDFAHTWKKRTPLKQLKPVVINCKHYQLLVKENMVVGIKGAGNATQKVNVKPGEHLIFDDQGHLVYIMNADSFARKCVESTTIEKTESKPKEETGIVPEIVELKTPQSEVKKEPQKAPEKKQERKSSYEILEAEILDVMQILDKPNPSKEEKERLPQELKDIEKRTKSTAKSSTIAYIEKKAKKIEEGKKLSKEEIVKLALAAQPLIRTGRSVVLDTLFTNKKRLEPTIDGLLRWLKAPSRYDLIGVDVNDDVEPTVTPKPSQRSILEILRIQ
ncbi:MAG: hypothetical protein AAF242_14310 [Bacteroidota bacterium]